MASSQSNNFIIIIHPTIQLLLFLSGLCEEVKGPGGKPIEHAQKFYFFSLAALVAIVRSTNDSQLLENASAKKEHSPFGFNV